MRDTWIASGTQPAYTSLGDISYNTLAVAPQFLLVCLNWRTVRLSLTHTTEKKVVKRLYLYSAWVIKTWPKECARCQLRLYSKERLLWRVYSGGGSNSIATLQTNLCR